MLLWTFFTSLFLQKCTHLQHLELTKMEAFLLFWDRSHCISLRFEFSFPSVLMGCVWFMFVDRLDFSLLWSVCSNVLSILLLDSLLLIEYNQYISPYISMYSSTLLCLFTFMVALRNRCSFSYGEVCQSLPLLLALCVSCLKTSFLLLDYKSIFLCYLPTLVFHN